MADIPPMRPPSPDAGKHIDWDTPVGYAHGENLLAHLRRLDKDAGSAVD